MTTSPAVQEHIEASKRLSQHAKDALQPYTEYLCEKFSDRQWWRAENAIRRVFEEADYTGSKTVLVETHIERITHGRKGSPRGVFSITVDVSFPGEEYSGALGHILIGRHGKVDGSIYQRSMFGRTVQLGK